MDIQTGLRSIDLKFSDRSEIQAEFYFKFSTEDEESIASTLLENLLLTNALNPMQGIVLSLLSESNETEDDDTDDDEIELELEEAA